MPMFADALSTQILQNNESLQAARLSLKGEELTLRTVVNLPDPEIEMEIMASPASSLELTVSETVEWPGVYQMRKKARESRINASQYLFESKRLDVVKQARLAYLDLINLNSRLARRRRFLQVLDSMLRKVSDVEMRTEFNVLEISKMKIDAFDIASDISSLEIQRQVVLSDLVQMNGGKNLENVDLNCTIYPIEKKSVDYYVSAYYNSPDYAATLSNLQADEFDVKAGKRSWWPNITLGYKFTSEGDARGHGAVIGFSIPLFSNRGKVKASQAIQQANDFAKTYQSRKGEADIRSRYNEVERISQSIEEYGKRLNYAEVKKYLDEALAAKSITIIDYLAEYQFILSALQKLDDMRSDLMAKYIELSKYDSLD